MIALNFPRARTIRTAAGDGRGCFYYQVHAAAVGSFYGVHMFVSLIIIPDDWVFCGTFLPGRHFSLSMPPPLLLLLFSSPALTLGPCYHSISSPRGPRVLLDPARGKVCHRHRFFLTSSPRLVISIFPFPRLSHLGLGGAQLPEQYRSIT